MPGLELYLAVISPHQSPNLYVNLGVVTNSISNIFWLGTRLLLTHKFIIMMLDVDYSCGCTIYTTQHSAVECFNFDTNLHVGVKIGELYSAASICSANIEVQLFYRSREQHKTIINKMIKIFVEIKTFQ